jgi:hypothetical protein
VAGRGPPVIVVRSRRPTKRLLAPPECLSVQPNTVRARLKALFAKTGTGRQGKLVNLLRAPS